MIKKVKRQLAECGKYLQIIYLTGGLYIECMKNTYNSTLKRYTSQLKMGKGFEQTFLQRKYANSCNERMLNIISHQKDVNQNQRRYFFTPTRMVESKSQIIVIVHRDMEKSELLCSDSGSVKWSSPL